MAAKKRRKRKSNPKKRSHARKRRRNPVRAVASNPKRSHKRRRKANPRRRARRANAAVANPRRRRARRAHAANPRRRRARRRNPGIPVWALAGIAAAAGLAAFAVGQAGSFAITQRTQEGKKENLDRNRYIAFGVLTAAGLGLAAFVKSPAVQMVGAGLASGGLVGLAGTELSLALSGVIDAKDAKGAPVPLAGVFDGGAQQFAGMYDVPQFAGVYDDGQQQFAGVFENGQQDFAG